MAQQGPAQPTSHVPAITVVIPVYNAQHTLGAQLEALAQETLPEPWELIVVDDASSDSSADVAATYHGRLPLRLVRQETNGGAASARNAGAALAHSDFLGFLDADDVIAPGWLSAAVRVLRAHDAAGSRFDVDTLNPPEVRAARRGPQQDGLQEYDYPSFLPHCGGCGLMVRRHVHEAIGGFDTSLPALEDTDYVWRLQLAGFELHFAADAVVRIRYRDSSVRSAQQAYTYGYYNVILYMRYRNRGMGPLPWRSGARRLLRIFAPQMLIGLLDRDRRMRWLRLVGFQLGRVAASLSLGVWAL